MGSKKKYHLASIGLFYEIYDNPGQSKEQLVKNHCFNKEQIIGADVAFQELKEGGLIKINMAGGYESAWRI
jgi:hypothetical protein